MDEQASADSLYNQAVQHYQHSEFPQAFQCLQQCLQLYQEIGDGRGIAKSWGLLGDIERNRGNWDEAERLYRQCLEIETELGDRSGMASSWGLLGDIERNRGNWDEAERLYQKKLDTCRELGDKFGMGTVSNTLAFVYKELKQIPQALAAWREGLAICPPTKFPLEALFLGENLGDAAFDIQDWETAIEGYQAATEAVETRCGFTDSYLEKQNRREAAVEIYEKLVQACINAGDIGKAIASVERSKSRNLIELLSNRELSPSGDVPPELRQELDRLRREVTAKQRMLESLDTSTDSDVGGEPGLGQRGAGSSSYTPEAVAALRQNYEQAQQALTELLDTLKSYLVR